MKTFKLSILALLFIAFTSCSNDDDGNNPQSVEAETVSNLYAPQEADYSTTPPTITGDFIKFAFETGGTVTGDSWDIAFRGTTILINGGEATSDGQPERTGEGGAYIATSAFDDLSNVDTSAFIEDSLAGGLAIQDWYDYNPTTHVISPVAGKILIIKTHDGKYAKVEILSYYQDGAPNIDATNYQYYTFNYSYQPNEGVTSFN